MQLSKTFLQLLHKTEVLGFERNERNADLFRGDRKSLCKNRLRALSGSY